MKKTSILLTAACALLLAACTNSNTPESVVKDFYTATQNNDFNKAMTYTNLDPENYDQVVGILENMGMVIHHFEVLNSSIDEGDSTAIVTLNITSSNAIHPDSLSNELIVQCVKVDKDWKVRLN